MTRRCTHTPDLLYWKPPELVERFEEPAVRSSTLRDRISASLRRKRNDKILTERGGPGLRGSIHYRAEDDRLQQGTN